MHWQTFHVSTDTFARPSLHIFVMFTLKEFIEENKDGGKKKNFIQLIKGDKS